MALLAVAAFHSMVRFWKYPMELERPSSPCTWIEDRDGRPMAAFVGEGGQWHLPLEWEQVSPHLLQAVVAVEDGRFYEHGGVDWRAVAGASWQNLLAMRPWRGASTITMQLHRLRQPAERGWAAKLTQAIRAEQIERRLDKRHILLEYINRAPFGGNLVGAGAASWRYFGRPCRQLSLGQAALLAGLPKNPNQYRPDRFPQRAAARRDHVLERMAALGMISAEQRDEAMGEPIDAQWRPLPQNAAVADGSLPALVELGRRCPGRSVRSTLDGVLQHQVAAAARQHLESLKSSGVDAAAVVVLDTPSAQVLASVSLGEEAREMDLCRAPRSTGSTLKPLIYAAAFDAGLLATGSMVDDVPAAWAGYAPANYDRQFRGRMSAAAALAQSRNIPALTLLERVGVERTVGLMEACGLRTLGGRPERYGLSLAIGGAEATPLEVAEAYATLARGGSHRPATLLVDDERPRGAAVLRAEACRLTLQAIRSGARTARICPEAERTGVAWKTGTSSGHRDAWCAAATASRTVVVWLGNTNGRGSAMLVGQDAAAPLALQLAAMVAPAGGMRRDELELASSEPLEAAAQASGPLLAKLTVASPADGMQITIDPDVPAERQRVALRAVLRPAVANVEGQRLWWFVDGEPLREGGDSPGAWWTPASGMHELRVVDATGRAAVARVRVR